MIVQIPLGDVSFTADRTENTPINVLKNYRSNIICVRLAKLDLRLTWAAAIILLKTFTRLRLKRN